MAFQTASEFIEKELELIKVKGKEIEDTEIISCVAVMVQIRIRKTDVKQLVACFQFPEDYPQTPIITELKSKKLSGKLLDGLTKICDLEAKKFQGQRQILLMVEFVKKFIEEHPLCCCSEEITAIKRKLLGPQDEIKLKQKNSQIILKLKKNSYYLNARITIPDDYPCQDIWIEIYNHNLPQQLTKNCGSQCTEIARQCIEPPLKIKPKDPPFIPKLPLYPVADYLIAHVIHKCPAAVCPLCNESSLPADPKNVVNDPKEAEFVYHMYCGHLFHNGCLDTFMKKPPFTGGKKCPSCGKRIWHDRWHISPELAEARWAHQEARERELAEVEDFLQ